MGRMIRKRQCLVVWDNAAQEEGVFEHHASPLPVRSLRKGLSDITFTYQPLKKVDILKTDN